MQKNNELGTALITGASSGIGEVYAIRLAQRGFDLLLVARDLVRLEALAVRLRESTGVKVETIKADLTNQADVLEVVRRVGEDSSISMLVNNAGIAMNGPLLGADLATLNNMISLNVVAVSQLAVAAATAFSARKKGTLINIASVLALAPELFNGAYSGTKAFVLNLTQALQREVSKSGVRVQVVLPGATRTALWDRAGIDISNMPSEMMMDVHEMVDAALAGLDQGETVTIPSLPDSKAWEELNATRLKLGPLLSLKHAAPRYRAGNT